MSQTIGTVLIDVKGDTSKLVSGMQNAEKSVDRAIGNMKNTILTLGTAYLSISSVNAFAGMVSGSIEAADAAGKLSKKLGVTTEELSKYQYTADLAGVSQGQLNAGLSAMIRRLNNFQRDGGGAAKKAMEELGISADYARENMGSTDEAFKEILKRLEKMPDGYKKTAIAQDIFSKSASNLINLTASDLETLGAEASKVGLVISESSAAMAAEYNDNIDMVAKKIEGLQRQVSMSLLPELTANSEAMNLMFESLSETIEEFSQNSDFMESFSNNMTTMSVGTVSSLGFIGKAFIGTTSVISTTVTGWEGIISSFEAYFNRVGYAIDYWSARSSGNAAEMETALKGYNGEADKWRKEIGENDKELQTFLQSNQLLVDGINSATDAFEKNIKKAKEAKDANSDASGPGTKTIPGTTAVMGATHTIDLGLDDATKNVIDQYNAALGLVTPELDKINNQYGAMYEVVSLLFSEEQMQVFYAKWGEAIDVVNEKSKDNAAKLTVDYNGVESQDWTAGLDDTARGYANISNAIADLVQDQGKYTKAIAETNKALAAGKTVTEDGTDLVTYKADLEAKHGEAQLSYYSNLAGSMAGAFEEGSRGAEAMLVVQTALSVAAGLTAVANAGMGDPYTAVVRMVAVAATLASFGMSLGSNGDSSSSGSTPVNNDSYRENIDNSSNLIVERLDRQIDLLEVISLQGTAGKVELDKAQATFIQDYQSTVEDLVEGVPSIGGYGLTLDDSLEDFYNSTYKVWAGYRDAFFESYTVDADALREGFDAMEYINVLRELSENGLESMVDGVNINNGDESGFEEIDTLVEEIIGGMQQAITDYALTMTSVVDEMSDAADSFRDLYDNISGTTKYEDIALAEATADVDALRGDSTFLEYLESQIEAISELENSFDTDIRNLLLSTDSADLSAQQDALYALQDATNLVFDNGVEDALNYIDSIELVGSSMVDASEAMANSLSLLDDLYLGQYGGLTMLERTDYANNVAYGSIETGSTTAIDDAYQALVTAAASATRDEDIAFERAAYAQLLEDQVEDSSRTDIVNELKSFKTEVLSEITDLRRQVEQSA